MRQLMFVLLLIAIPGVAAAAYKCDNGGQIVYSDAPCGKVVGTLKQAPAPSALDQARALAELSSMRQRNTFDADIERHRVRIGMSANDVIASWGSPTKINTTVTPGLESQQWVYRKGPGVTQYVYIDNGRVKAISSN